MDRIWLLDESHMGRRSHTLVIHFRIQHYFSHCFSKLANSDPVKILPHFRKMNVVVIFDRSEENNPVVSLTTLL